MKNLYLIIIIVLLGVQVNLFAQDGGVSIGKGDADADPSAILELVSTNKGLLIPRLTSSERGNIDSPATGLLVYDTSLSGFYYWTGSSWKAIAGINSSSGTVLPSSAGEGDLFYNTSTNNLFVYAENAWASIGSSKQILSLDNTTLKLLDEGTQNGSEVDLTFLLQNLVLDGTVLSITNGNSVDLASFLGGGSGGDMFKANYDADDNNRVDDADKVNGMTVETSVPASAVFSDSQTLSVSGSTLTIAGGNSVTLPSGGSGTDSQILSISGNTLSITGGNSVVLPTGNGTGDMTQSVYDTDSNSKVDEADNADKVNGLTVDTSVPVGAVFTDDQTLNEILTSGTSAGGKQITNLGTPTTTTDAATKGYVDDSVSGLEDKTNKNIAGGYVGLETDGKINQNYLPAGVNLGTVYTVGSQSAQDVLSPVSGDVAIRTDESKTYVYDGSSWVELQNPTDAVTSVNGQTGVVSLTTAEVSSSSDKNYVTDGQLTILGNTSGTNTGDQDISGIATNAADISTNAADIAANTTNITANTNAISGLGTASGEDVGTGAGNVVQLDGSGRLPAVDGSQLTNLPDAPVTSVNGQVGVVSLSKSDVGLGNVDNTSDADKPVSTAMQTSLDLKEDKTNKNVAGGYVGLETDGKINQNYLPAGVNLGTVYTVGSQLAQDGLSPMSGDVAIRTDESKTYVYDGSSWVELQNPTDAVTSVNGQTGVVSLTTAEVSSSSDKNYVTDGQLTILGNTSGTNTGDQDISGIATNAAEIAANTTNITTNTNAISGLGTASGEDIGTGAGNVIQLDGSGRLPAVDGSQLTNLPSSPVTSVNGETGDVSLSSSEIGYDNATSGLTSTDVKSALDELATGAAGGDMTKLDYDTDNNSKVDGSDNADKVNGLTVETSVPSGAVFTDDQNLSEVLTSGTSAGGSQITNLGTPTAVTDAATKGYVDNSVSGFEEQTNKNVAGGYVGLEIDGKINQNYLPAGINLSTVYTVGDQSAQDGLSPISGDVAIRTDESKTYVYDGSSWVELQNPTDAVTSVNGQVGVVSLSKTDVGLGNVDNTSDLDKPVSTATQSSLDLKANTSDLGTASGEDVGTGAGNVVQLDGSGRLPVVDGSQLTNLPAAPVTSVAGYTGDVSLTTSDVTESTNKNYVTDAQLTILGNTSGTNTGDQSADDVSVTASGNLTSTDVQSALVELQSDIDAGANGGDMTKVEYDTDGNSKADEADNADKVNGLTVETSVPVGAVFTDDQNLSEVLTSGTSAGGGQITNLGTPTAVTDAATKGYVDNSVSGFEEQTNKNVAGGYVGLETDGKINQNYLPAGINLSTVYTVGDQSAQDALSPISGDVAIRADESKTYVYDGSSWVELQNPTDAVTSVNGQVGVVSLSKTDVGLGNVDNTSDLDKPVSTATQSSLDLKANTSDLGTASGEDVGTGAGNVVQLDGSGRLPVVDGSQLTNLPAAPVTSVAGYTGDVSLTTSDVTESTNKNYVTDGQLTILGNTSGINTGDQDISGIAANTTNITTNTNAISGLGTASGEDIGTGAGNVIQLDGSGRLPAVDGSQLTNLPDAPVASVNGQVGVVSLSKSDVGLGNVDNTSDADKPVSTAMQTSLDLKEDKTNKNIAGGYVGLETDGKINQNYLPAGVNLGTVYTVGSQLAQDGLSPMSGDVAIRTDESKTYVYDGSSWVELQNPTDAVTSVNGQTGVVSLTTAEVSSSSDKNYVTDGQLTILGNTSGTNTGDQDISGISTNAADIATNTTNITTNTNAISGLGTASGEDIGTGAGNVIQLDGSGRLPAVDGSQLTNLPDAPVTSVNGQVGVVSLSKSDVGLGNVDNTSDADKPVSTAMQTSLDLKEDKTNKNVAGGYVGLETDGKINQNYLPAGVNLGTVYTVGSQLAQDGLSPMSGDVAIRTDESKTYVYDGSSWVELQNPTDAVTSVNGQTGVVSLTTAEVSSSSDKNYVTDGQLTILGNTSGTNTGDQDISGIATNAAEIAANTTNITTNTNAISGLGTASGEDIGTGAGNVIQLDGSGRLPAVDGSQLTNLPSSPVTSVNGETGDVSLSSSEIGYDNATSGLTSTDVKSALDELATGAAGGDMTKLDYDTDNNSKVDGSDNADKVNGLTVETSVPSGAVFTDDQNLSEVLTSGTSAGGSQITNLGTPTAVTDAATKGYVDNSVSGFEEQTNKNVAGGYVGLEIDGKINQNYLPAGINLSTVYTVGDQSAQDGLSPISGDVAIRTDESKTYVYDGSSWVELQNPTDAVTSVNGQVGVVSLSKTDVGLGNVDNTSDLDKPVSTATQSSLDLKANTSDLGTASGEDVGTGAGNVVQLDGSGRLPVVDGSQLTNLPAAPVTSVAGYTGDVSLTTSDVTESTNKNYVTDGQLTILGNTSGTNTGDQSAGEVSVTASGNLTSTDVQSALVELQSDIDAGANGGDMTKVEYDTDGNSKADEADNADKVNGLTVETSVPVGAVFTDDQNLSEVLTSGTSAGGGQITNLGTPTAVTDAATKGYVDNSVSGFEEQTNKNVAGGYVGLETDGKINQNYLPAGINLSTVYTVGDQSAQDALSPISGDVAIRADESKTYVYDGSSWVELQNPTDAVTSVNGQVGVVSLSKTDVGLGNVDNTSDLDKPVSTATQSSLDLKANTSDLGTASGEDVGTGAGNVVQLDGSGRLPVVDGSQLTNLPAAPVTSVAGYTGDVSLTTSDVTESTNKNYVTDGQLTILGNTSGTNTGDQSAGEVSVTASGNLTSTDVQSALVELQSDIDAGANGGDMTKVVYDADDNGTVDVAETVSDGAITTAKIASDAVTAAEIASDAVTTSEILDGTIAASDLGQMLATDGQVLKWDATANAGAGGWVASDDDNTNTTVVNDLTTGGTTDALSAEMGKTLQDNKLETSASFGGDVSGTYDAIEIAADAVTAAEIASDAVTTSEILDGAVADSDLDKANIPLSGFGNAAADVSMGDGTTNYKITNVLDPVSSQDVATKKYVDDNIAAAGGGDMLKTVYDADDNGTVDVAETVSDGAITTAKIASDAVTTSEILDGTIAASDLGQMSASDGQILKWDATANAGAGGWVASDDDNTNTTVVNDLTTGGTTDALSAEMGKTLQDNKLETSASFGGDVSGTYDAIEIAADAVTAAEIASDAVTTSEILDGTIAASDLGQMLATDGQVLKWDATANAGAGGWVASNDDNTNTTVVNDLTTGGTTDALSAEMGKTLQDNKLETSASFGGDVSGTYDAIEIATDAVTTTEILDGTIAASDFGQMSASDGQILKWDATANAGAGGWVASDDDNTNTTVVNDLTTGGTTDALSAEMGKTLQDNKLETSASFGGDVSGTYDAIEIAADAVTAAEIASDAVTTSEILDGTIAASDLGQMLATDGQVLKWDATANAGAGGWVASDDENTNTTVVNDLTTGGTTDALSAEMGKTLQGNKLETSASFGGDVSGTYDAIEIAADAVTAAEIASDAVTTSEILDGTIAASDLGQMLATDGQVLKWDATANAGAGGWVASDDENTNTTVVNDLTTGGTTDALSAEMGKTLQDNKLETSASFGGDVSGTYDAIEIATDAVTTSEILDGAVADSDLDKANIPLSGFGNAAADVSMGDGTTNYKITNVLDPVSSQDVATKKYVDDNIAAAGGGDMLKTVYDADDNGTVDVAETVSDDAITTAKIASDAVTTSEILDGTIAASDLGQMLATDGQVLKWDATANAGAGGWVASDDDNTNTTVVNDLTTGGTTDALSAEMGKTLQDNKLETSASFGGDVSGTYDAIEIAVDAVTAAEIASDAVTTSEILDGTIAASDLGQMLATDGQILKWDATANAGAGGWVASDDDNTNTTVVNDLTTGGTTDALSAEMGKTLQDNKLETSASFGGDVSGTYDAIEIAADAVTAAEIASDAVTTSEILDGTIAASDLGQMLATDGQVLKWDATANAGAGGWVASDDDNTNTTVVNDLTTGGTTDALSAEMGKTLQDNKLETSASFGGDVSGTYDAIEIATDAVTTTEILDGTIAASDLGQMLATDGQVLKWDATANAGAGGWVASDDDNTNTTVVNDLTTGGTTDALSAEMGKTLQDNKLETSASFGGDVSGTYDAIEIATDAVTTTEILDGTIAASDLGQMLATDGQVLKWDATANAGAGGWVASDDDNTNTTVVNDLTTGGTTDALSAEMGKTLQDNKLETSASFGGDVSGTYDAIEIASDAVTTTEILDGTIAASDLGQMSASDGQVLKWDATANAGAGGWVASDDDNTNTTVVNDLTTGGTTDALSAEMGKTLQDNKLETIASFGGDVSGTYDAIEIAADAVTAAEIASDAVTTSEILDGTVGDSDLDKANIPLSGFGNAAADVSMGDGTTNYKITNVLDPVSSQDVATKKYVDDNIAAAGGGDMLKTVYDVDDNGTVDVAETVSDGAIITAKIASDAVTTSEILDGTIAASDLGQMLATDGQVLKWDATANAGAGGWVASDDDNTNTTVVNDLTTGGTTDALSAEMGKTLQDNKLETSASFGGDVSGTYDAIEIASDAVTTTEILDGTIAASDLGQMLATDGQVLKWDATANAGAGGWVASDDDNTNTTVVNDLTTGGTTDALSAEMGKTLQDNKLETSASFGGDVSGTYDAIEIAADAVTAAEIASDAVTTSEILDGTIAASDLGQMLATDGQVLKWDATANAGAGGWVASDDDNTNTTVVNDLTTGGTTDALSAEMGKTLQDNKLETTASFGGDVSGTYDAIEIAADAVTTTEIADGAVTETELAADAVTTVKIADGQVTSAKLDHMGASTDDFLKWDGFAWTPQSISGTLAYKGSWDATSNSPNLSNATGTAGDYYVVSVAGTRDLGSGSISFNAGDWAIYNGSIWQQINNSSDVNSVFGRTGIITAQANDYTWGQINKTTSSLNDIADVVSATKTSGNILVADGTSWNSSSMGGDATLDNSGVLTIGSGKITSDKILDGTIAASDLGQMSASDGQVLKWDATANAGAGGWVPNDETNELPSLGTAGNVLAVNASGDGLEWSESVPLSGDVSINSSGEVTVEKLQNIEVSSSAPGTNQVLMYNGTTWSPGDVSTTDEKVMVNGGTNALPLSATDFVEGINDISIAGNAITNEKIADGTITAADLGQMLATDGQVMKWDATANAGAGGWVASDDDNTNTTVVNDLTTGGTTDALSAEMGKTLQDNKLETTASFGGDVSGTYDAIVIASDAVTTTEILDGTIAASDLGQMLATDGQVIKWDATANAGAGGWVASDDDNTNTTVVNDLTTGGITDALSAEMGKTLQDNKLETTASFGGDVSGTYDAIVIASDAVTTSEILDGTIAASDLGQMLATDGQVMKWDATANAGAGGWVASDDDNTNTTVVNDLTTGGTTDALSAEMGKTLQDNKLETTASFGGDVSGTYDAIVIASDAVTTSEILDGTIAAADLGQMSATDGQFLKWDATANSGAGGWVATSIQDSVTTIINDLVTGGTTDALSAEMGKDLKVLVDAKLDTTLSGGNLFVGNADGKATGVALSGDATIDVDGKLSLKKDSVTTVEILDGTIQAEDLSQMSATNGQVMTWDDTANSGAGGWVPFSAQGGNIIAGTAENNTIRWDGTAWSESTALTDDGTYITITGNLNIGEPTISHIVQDIGDFAIAGDVEANGDLWVDGTLNTPSDERLKKNIATLTNILDKLNKLRGVTYEFKDQQKYASGPQIGVIAQELQKVFPELVSQGADGYLAVNYSQLSAVILQAVKEQQKEIEQLQQQMEKVMNKLGMK